LRFVWEEPEPSAKVASAAEGSSVADAGHHGAGDDWSNSWHTHEALAGLIGRDKGFDLTGDSIDTLIQMMPVLHQASDQAHHAGREDVGALGENVRQGLPQRSEPLSHRNSALQQEGADLVDHCRALADQAGANAMKSLQIELFDTLCGHKPHGGPLHGFSNGFGITEVVLVALAERLHELGGDQLHVVAQCEKLAAEMMGADTGFHANQAGWHVGQPSLNLPSRELLVQDNGPAGIQANQVEAVLADVDP
jgi:hypothetical protein